MLKRIDRFWNFYNATKEPWRFLMAMSFILPLTLAFSPDMEMEWRFLLGFITVGVICSREFRPRYQTTKP